MRALTPRGALLLISILVGGCAVAHAPVVASSDPPELIPIHRFFANREANWGYRISPDGVRLGWITSHAGRSTIFFKQIDSGQVGIIDTHSRLVRLGPGQPPCALPPGPGWRRELSHLPGQH